MSTLVIAEKKEVGTAIANAFSKMLGIPIQQKNGVSYIGDFVVTELAGHVMKLKEWEDYDSIYFSWSKKSKVRMLSSVIFSHKNNKVINTLLDMLMIFWENNDSVPNYFILQILYNELIENYYKKEQCQVISDTFPHEMFRVWFDKYSEDKLQEIIKKSSIHKLSFKIENSKRKKDGTFFEYFENMYKIK